MDRTKYIGNEYFKDIPEYEGLYKISNLGRVLSLPKNNPKGYGISHNGKILKPYSYKGHYFVVSLKTKKVYIHRLVLENFSIKPKGQDFCNHINGDRFDNSIFNLEWVTQKENCQHAYSSGHRKITKKMRVSCSEIGKRSRKFTIKQAEMIKHLNSKYTYYSIGQLLNVDYKIIRNIVLNKTYREA